MASSGNAYIVVTEPDSIVILECVDFAIETALAGGFVEMAEMLGGLYSRFWASCRPFFVDVENEKEEQ